MASSLGYWAWAAIILAGAIAAVLLLAALKNGDFSISRKAVIAAPPEAVFPHIVNLQAMDEWNPFVKSDPNIAMSYSGAEAGPGAQSSWTSTGRGGQGRLEVTEARPHSRAVMILHMEKPFQCRNDIVFELRPSGTGTEVSWTMSGTNSFMGRLMNMLFNMDRMVGGSFEKGLADLNAIVGK